MAQLTADQLVQLARQGRGKSPVDLGQSTTTIGVDGEVVPKSTQLNAAQLVAMAKQQQRANFKPFDWKASQKEGMTQAAKNDGGTSWGESSLLGLTNLGATAAQAFYKASDLLDAGINTVTGTNYLPTNRYEQYTKQRKGEEDFHQLRREQNNQGFDWWKLAGELANPLAAYGKGYQGAKILSKEGAKITGQNALLGMGIGGAGFAEDSDERLSNSITGGIGGAAGGVIGEKIGQGVSKIATRLSPSNATTQNIDSIIDSALKNSADDSIRNLTSRDLSATAREGIRKEIKSVLSKGKSVDSKTVERMAIFNDLKASGIDLKPTGKQATGNPNLWTKETELSKLDGGAALNNRYISQNKELIDALEQASALTNGTSINRLQTGESVIDALSTKDTARNQLVKDMYQVAKNHSGNDLVINPHSVVENSKQAMIDNFINPDKAQSALLAKLKPFMDSENPKPFTLKDKELFVKQINAAMGKTSDGETRAALGIVRNALEEEADNSLNQFGSALSGEAKNAWEAARLAASQRFKDIERNPALKAAIDDIAPDQFFEKFVLSKSSAVRDVKALTDELKDHPDAMNNLRLEIMRFVANNAVTKQGDSISPAGINRALQAIGDDKLKLFFSSEELKHLKSLNAASKYLFSQPMGSNVNHSNSASAFVNLMGYMNLLKKVPVIGPKLDSVSKNAVDSVGAQLKINQGTNAISKTATQNPQFRDNSLIDRLTRAGIISGSNLPNQ